jgi:hypothetical protein
MSGPCSVEGCDRVSRMRGWCEMHYRRWQRHGDPLGGRTPEGTLLTYLHDVVLPWSSDECLIWPYGRSGIDGYGRMRLNGRTQLVSRIACEAVHGSPPTPLHQAAHSCGNGHLGCVNPRHVRWATRVENEADKLAHGTHARGERSANAKLTDAAVRQIRALVGTTSAKELARQFGVSTGAISRITRGDNWAWLKGEAGV